jgi:hypothetical protein
MQGRKAPLYSPPQLLRAAPHRSERRGGIDVVHSSWAEAQPAAVEVVKAASQAGGREPIGGGHILRLTKDLGRRR